MLVVGVPNLGMPLYKLQNYWDILLIFNSIGTGETCYQGAIGGGAGHGGRGGASDFSGRYTMFTCMKWTKLIIIKAGGVEYGDPDNPILARSGGGGSGGTTGGGIVFITSNILTLYGRVSKTQL